ncbi:MAG: glycosyltransferase involved in cell wall biosynthesis [Granulosicoccus sp.]|jgi:glycosyltransferase involved in cell wall biosynthesis
MSAGKHMFIIVSNYPFGFAEPFLEPELRHLATRFDRIHIITTEPCQHIDQQFVLPDNAEVVHANIQLNLIQKLFSLWRIFGDTLVKTEINSAQTVSGERISWGAIKSMVVARTKSSKLFHRLKHLIKSRIGKDDEVILYSYWCSEYAHSIALLAKEQSNYSSFARAHGWDLYFERSSYNYLPFRLGIFNGLDAVFTISENGRNYLLTKFAQLIDPNKIISSRLGIDTTKPKLEMHRRFRRFRIVSCSNLISIKRVDLLIKSLSHVDDLEIEWVHFGEGVLMHDLKVLAHQLLDLKRNISFSFRGRVPNWELLNYYAENEIDLFVTVSKWDGIPVSIMEAMSFGIPTVATDVGGVAEIVLNGQNGLLLPTDPNPQQVAESLTSVAKMPDMQYMKLRARAQEVWGTFYSAKVNYPIFCDRILDLKNSREKTEFSTDLRKVI